MPPLGGSAAKPELVGSADQPLLDRVRELAEVELPAPRTLEVTCWEDGDFAVHVHHTGDAVRETVRYRQGEGQVVYRALAGGEVREERVLERVEE